LAETAPNATISRDELDVLVAKITPPTAPRAWVLDRTAIISAMSAVFITLVAATAWLVSLSPSRDTVVVRDAWAPPAPPAPPVVTTRTDIFAPSAAERITIRIL
jgi:hypothetical protein